MKEKIYTIPVNEAFDSHSECPFCYLREKMERDVVDFVMGPSYMDEDIRAITDKMGFCDDHFVKMYNSGNKLGLALILSTHLKKINKDLSQIFDSELNEKRKGFFEKKHQSSPYCQFNASLQGTCYACEKISERMESYYNTFFYLFKTEPEFCEKIRVGKGFCLDHLGQVIKKGKKALSPKIYEQLLQVVIPLQKENLERLDKELEWFIQKFDYRFQEEPWKDSKDAPERGILKVSGAKVK